MLEDERPPEGRAAPESRVRILPRAAVSSPRRPFEVPSQTRCASVLLVSRAIARDARNGDELADLVGEEEDWVRAVARWTTAGLDARHVRAVQGAVRRSEAVAAQVVDAVEDFDRTVLRLSLIHI